MSRKLVVLLVGVLVLSVTACTGTSGSAVMPATQETAQGCVAAEGTAVFADEDLAYCFAYPDMFVAEGSAEALIVSPAPGRQGQEPRPPFVAINVTPADGRTAADIADEEAEFASDPAMGMTIARETVSIGGEAAQVLGGMPGMDLSRVVLVVHDDRLYRMVFLPDDPAAGEIFAQLETLYETVTGSMQFGTN